MAEGKPGNPWSELNEHRVVEKMLGDANSEYWSTCREYVRYFIGGNFLNLPAQIKEEVVQETILSIYRGLSSFRGQCKFTTWVISVARSRAIDALRRQSEIEQWETGSEDAPDHAENETEPAPLPVSKTPEEIVLTNDQIHEVFAKIEEFLRKHGKAGRNRRILQLVLVEGYTQEEAAQILGVPAPVIGYVVRTARNYLRHELSFSSETNK
jgi:RNA polymerase sigma-70 factor (ECF subfamily)